MNERDLESLRRTTANYACLQGLKIAPWSVPLLVVAAASAPWWPVPYGAPTIALLVVSFAGAALVSLRLGRFYVRRFGVVRPTRTQRRRWAVWSACGFVVVVGAAFADAALQPRVIVFGVVLAAALLLYWERVLGLRRRHVLLAGLLVAVSAVRLVLPDVAREDAWSLLLAAIAIVYALAGLSDHRHLVRTLGRGRPA
jgi:hypothetical protein